MEIERQELVPDASLSHDGMLRLQREVSDVAAFDDGTSSEVLSGEPLALGIDQSFPGEKVVSAVVGYRGGEEVLRHHSVSEAEMEYVPGLLSFREGGPIVDALTSLGSDIDPDVLLLDGSGRLHFREAGIATHIGVLFDVPSVGVAKSLLCGEPRRSLDEPLDEGERVPVLADEEMTAEDGEIVGYAYQSKQYDDTSDRHVNPLYVSPGHLLSPEESVEVVDEFCRGYKLPEPVRAADSYADEVRESSDLKK